MLAFIAEEPLLEGFIWDGAPLSSSQLAPSPKQTEMKEESGGRGTHLNMFGEEGECPGLGFFQVLTLGFTFDIQTIAPSLTSPPGCTKIQG